MENTLTKPVTPSIPRPSRTLLDTTLFMLQRLAFGALILIFIIYLSYLGLDMARGNDFSTAVAQAVWKTGVYLGNILQGDLGLSAAGSITLRPIPITDVIADTLPKSLGLLGASLLTASVVGILLGLLAARYRRSSGSLLILLTSIIGISAPSFFVALVLQLLVINLTQSTGERLLPVGGFGWDAHIILPMLVLAVRPVAQITRIAFVSVGDILDQDFIRTAHSKGIRPVFILSDHVVRNAAIPILTTIGLSLRFSLSSLPVVEYFFGWNGVGFILLKAIARQDDNLTVSLLLCLGIFFILVNLLLEMGYRFIDPRLRQTPSHIDRERDSNAFEIIKATLADLWRSLIDNRLLRRLRDIPLPTETKNFTRLTTTSREDERPANQAIRAERRRKWLQATLKNLPLVLGFLMVAGLVFIIVFGPHITPHSPYTTQGLIIENGDISTPPFAPDSTYPWGTDVLGRDIMSLVIAGAQQTLILAVLVVLARLLVGFVLGAMAGWRNGRWLDRVIMGAAEIISAFPTLLLGMILILALGIRQGMKPFIIALCFVGWGEMMQFVRSEVTSIRPKLFIESAVAAGLRSPRIILSHVLPNLVPALISLAALEMAAVLMLLGELGFVGIFIGGGAFAELEWQRPLYHYSDVPEWGALLSNIRTYARAHYWMAVYPSLAFFVAILGFNLLGEGLRRMVEQLGVGITRLINRYTIGAVLAAFLVMSWVQSNTGAAAYYRAQALEFSGQAALNHVQNLTTPEMEGRGIGTAGLDTAAEYIAEEFEQLGLQAAGEDFTYFQTRKRAFGALTQPAELSLSDDGPTPVYAQDFAEYPYTFHRNWGQAKGPVRFLAVGDLTPQPSRWQVHPALADLDLKNNIVLVSSPREVNILLPLSRAGILVVADDDTNLQRNYTLSARDPNILLNQFGNRDARPDLPVLWVSRDTANRLLAETGQTIEQLRRTGEQLDVDEVYQLPTGLVASLNITGTVTEKHPVRHVIGHLPGTSAQLDKNMIIVMAQYDSPPLHPAQTYPTANNNASSIGIMLEVVRTMQTNYQPNKTFLFVAYSAEGQEGGEPAYPPDISKFLDAKFGFSDAFDIEAVVHLRGLGAGIGEGLAVKAGGSTRLAELFERAAHQVGVDTTRTGEAVDLSIVFEDRGLNEGGQEAPQVELNWQGWEETSRLPVDTPESISPDKIEQSGRALSLALMVLGRETQY